MGASLAPFCVFVCVCVRACVKYLSGVCARSVCIYIHTLICTYVYIYMYTHTYVRDKRQRQQRERGLDRDRERERASERGKKSKRQREISCDFTHVQTCIHS